MNPIYLVDGFMHTHFEQTILIYISVVFIIRSTFQAIAIMNKFNTAPLMWYIRNVRKTEKVLSMPLNMYVVCSPWITHMSDGLNLWINVV